jgi:hypothetical protein
VPGARLRSGFCLPDLVALFGRSFWIGEECRRSTS